MSFVDYFIWGLAATAVAVCAAVGVVWAGDKRPFNDIQICNEAIAHELGRRMTYIGESRGTHIFRTSYEPVECWTNMVMRTVVWRNQGGRTRDQYSDGDTRITYRVNDNILTLRYQFTDGSFAEEKFKP